MSSSADYFLIGVCLCCAGGAVLGAWSLKSDKRHARRILLAAKAAVLVAAALSLAAMNSFIKAFIGDDFSVEAVAKYSSSDMPFVYKLGAAWAAPAGLLLLLAVAGVVLFALWLVTLKTDGLVFNATAMIVGSVVCLGFSLVVLLVAKPFAGGKAAVAAGDGLSPLLRNFWMLIHPPAFVLAYSSFLIPFVVVVASVFGGDTETAELYLQLRRWLLLGVCLLSVGIVAGARWAYLELNWGGYWAWDPIQNLALLPLLGALAALHSINAIQLADKFRRWTLALAPVPFVLCLLLAFVDSSGILKTSHTFGRSNMAAGLLSFTCVCFLLWLFCFVRALSTVSIMQEQPSVFHFAKAKILLWSNVGFVGTAAAVGLATFLPVVLRTVMNSTSIQISTDFFYRRVIPIGGIALVFLVGFYRLADLRQRRDSSRLPTLACCAPAIISFGVLYRVAGFSLLLSLGCAAGVFSIVAIVLRLFVALANREKIGGYFAHFGVVIVLVSAGLSGAEKSIRTSLEKGGKLMLGDWEFVYDSFETISSNGEEKAGPRILLLKSDRRRASLWPYRSTYPARPQIGAKSRAAIDIGVFEDVCVSFEELTSDGKVAITAKIKPFMLWLWIGAALIIAGSALAALEGKAQFLPGLEAENGPPGKTHSPGKRRL
ncbi:MAG: cytochrome c biogenesis protein CcsA [Sedimentisphaerales bacterium]|nr:cytochrome c biogenesis protein CcsA [Sedimentisphaerales bacterium]